MTELKTDRDLVELLRQRVPEADRIDAARELWALLHNGRLPEGHQGAESERYYRNVTELFLASPAAQAVARALVGEIGSRSTEWCVFVGDHPESTERRMVGLSWGDAEVLRRRINARDFVPGSALESVFGGAEGQARVARRTAWTTTGHSSWQVVATESGEPS